MKTEKNDSGGKSIVLVADDLALVPKSHLSLVSPKIREAFPDPVRHYRRIAENCPFPAMASWLRSLTDGGNWELMLHKSRIKAWTGAGSR